MSVNLKADKYRIEDRFLRFFVGKYEHEIPWSTQVKDEESLRIYIRDTLYPEFIKKTQYPTTVTDHFYVTSKHVDVMSCLTGDAPSPVDPDKLRRVYTLGDVQSATQFLVDGINQIKHNAFKEWIDLLDKRYSVNKAFQLIVLKPLFKTSGFGQRRALEKPIDTIVEWLFQLLSGLDISPSFNFKQEYDRKQMEFNGVSTSDGWHYVDAKGDADYLSTLARRSGWCIAGTSMANYYLKSGCIFAILYEKKRPVVAIRYRGTLSRNTISEIQGPNNTKPTNWQHQIDYFIDKYEIEGHSDLDVNTWVQYALNNPNLLRQAERHILDQIFSERKVKIAILGTAIQRMTPEVLLQFIHDVQIPLAPEDIYSLLSEYPAREDLTRLIPLDNETSQKIEDLLQVRAFESVLKYGFILKDSSTFKSNILSSPRKTKLFTQHLDRYSNTRLYSYSERVNRIKINELIEPMADERFEASVVRIKDSIFNVEHSSFSNEIFPEALRSRPDFKETRAQGWMEAIKERPSYRLALPLDLNQEWYEQSPVSKRTNSVMLEKWFEKVEKSPWYLDAANTVPLSIRHHDHILNAYVMGWSKIILREPWKMWKKPSTMYPQRKYMNYAAFRNKHIIDSFIKGFQTRYNEHKASPRMFEMGAYQLAIFLAYGLLGDDKQGEATFFINKYNMSLPKGFPSDPMLQQLNKIYDGQIESVIEAYTGDSVLTTFGLSSTFG